MASSSAEPSPQPLSPPATEEAKGKRLKLEPERPDPRKMTMDEVKAMYDDSSFEFSTLVGRSGIVGTRTRLISSSRRLSMSTASRLGYLGTLMIILNFHLTRGFWVELVRVTSVIIIALSWSVSRRLPWTSTMPRIRIST